jgi:hypothetical protein
MMLPIPVAARSKAWVCGRSLARISGSKPTRGMDVCLVCVVCYREEVCRTGRSLVQRCPTKCDCESSTARRLMPTMAVEPRKNKKDKKPCMGSEGSSNYYYRRCWMASLTLGKTPPLIQCHCIWIWFGPGTSFDASDKLRASDH